MKWLVLLAVGLALACHRVPPVWAQITEEPARPRPDPRKFARGLFVDAELGTFVPLGKADALGSGVGLGGRIGYDLGRFFAVQAHVFGSTHRTDFGAAPQSGQLLQIYQLTGEVKLTLPLRQWALFVFGGGGIAQLSTNLLGTTGLTAPDDTSSLVLMGGAGLDYHPLTRHFSVGVLGAFSKLRVLEAPGGIWATAYLRYTF